MNTLKVKTTYESPKYRIGDTFTNGVKLQPNDTHYVMRLNRWNGGIPYYTIDDCQIDCGENVLTFFTGTDGEHYMTTSADDTYNYVIGMLEQDGIALGMSGPLKCINADVTTVFPTNEDGKVMVYNGTTWVTAESISATPTKFNWATVNNYNLIDQSAYGGTLISGMHLFSNSYTVNGSTVTKYGTVLKAGIKYPTYFTVDGGTFESTDYSPVELLNTDDICVDESRANLETIAVVGFAKRAVEVIKTAAVSLYNTIFTAIFGRYHLVNGTIDSIVTGSNNMVKSASNSSCFGHGHYLVNACCDTIFGAGNTLSNTATGHTDGRHRYNTCFGSHNTLQKSKNQTVFGSGNYAINCNMPSIIAGYKCNMKNNNSEQGAGGVVFGHYPSTKDLTSGFLEVVGNGTSSAGSDARILTPDGVEKCKGWLPMTTVTAAPTTAPTVVGLWQYDSTNKCFYIATGTSAATDWKKISLASI